MSAPDPPLALLTGAELSGDELKVCCAHAYADPAVRWLLGGELHPGGEEVTRRALALSGLSPRERLLDVASGAGTSAILAAREFGAEAVGIEYGEPAVEAAGRAAADAGCGDRVRFRAGDAEALPVEDGSFDVVLCECSLSTFPDQERAASELRRVLRPGGRLALSDVVVEDERLPAALGAAMGTVACVGGARSRDGYVALLRDAGFRLEGGEARNEDAERFAQRIEDRLRGARLLGMTPPPGTPVGIDEAIHAVRRAREAIDAGTLGYMIFAAVVG